jgi:NADP-dependent 3-hydroxy acid dehydrogenase YdfG
MAGSTARVGQFVIVAEFEVRPEALERFLELAKIDARQSVAKEPGCPVRARAGAYAGTKHALEALSQALRLELARTNVRLTNLQPGLVLTGLHRHMERHPKEALGIETPLAPDDVARAVLFVLREPAHVRVNSIQLVPGGQEL